MGDQFGNQKPKWNRKTLLCCKKCGHKWKPRIREPKECPHCRTSEGWDRVTTKRVKSEKTAKETAEEIAKLKKYQKELKALKEKLQISHKSAKEGGDVS
jgi:predicted Zn-ribbon and HTH transcriptional regulator